MGCTLTLSGWPTSKSASSRPDRPRRKPPIYCPPATTGQTRPRAPTNIRELPVGHSVRRLMVLATGRPLPSPTTWEEYGRIEYGVLPVKYAASVITLWSNMFRYARDTHISFRALLSCRSASDDESARRGQGSRRSRDGFAAIRPTVPLPRRGTDRRRRPCRWEPAGRGRLWPIACSARSRWWRSHVKGAFRCGRRGLRSVR
jgi:hypothetical protein